MHSDDHLADFTRFYESQAQPLIRSVAVATGRPAMAEDAVAEAAGGVATCSRRSGWNTSGAGRSPEWAAWAPRR
ncbi:MAG TPA: hypothetical protein VE265_01005, partial [Actinomycetota bacterium]|nr:hypothetical protein [Actinomycetota bacterium]